MTSRHAFVRMLSSTGVELDEDEAMALAVVDSCQLLRRGPLRASFRSMGNVVVGYGHPEARFKLSALLSLTSAPSVG